MLIDSRCKVYLRKWKCCFDKLRNVSGVREFTHVPRLRSKNGCLFRMSYLLKTNCSHPATANRTRTHANEWTVIKKPQGRITLLALLGVGLMGRESETRYCSVGVKCEWNTLYVNFLGNVECYHSIWSEQHRSKYWKQRGEGKIDI